MRTGLFGGCFDPIHHGHIAPVREAMQRLELDRVLYLPTAHPPHKADRVFAPALARYVMVELALLDEPRFEVHDLEMREDRPAYTVETVERLVERHPPDDHVLLIGGDAVRDLHRWHRWRDLLALVEVAVLTRSSSAGDELPDELRQPVEDGRIRLLDNAPVPLSSTELRRRLAESERVSTDEVPEPVLRYISKYGLYR